MEVPNPSDYEEDVSHAQMVAAASAFHFPAVAKHAFGL